MARCCLISYIIISTHAVLSKSIICDLTHSPIVLPLRNVVWLLLRGCYVVVVIVNDVVLILKIYKSPPLSLSLSLSLSIYLSPPLSLSLSLFLFLSLSLSLSFLEGGFRFEFELFAAVCIQLASNRHLIIAKTKHSVFLQQFANDRSVDDD